MGSELVPSSWGGNRVERREDSALARQIGGLERATTFGLARIEAQAQLEATRVMAVAHVGQQAMQSVAMVSQMEMQLARALPHAAHRFVGIAETTSFTLAQMVTDSARRIGK